MNKIVHEPSRLAILTALKAKKSLSFKELKESTDLTDGVIGIQTKNLEEAGYLKVEKVFVERKPRTTYEITTKGNKAFNDYIRTMKALISRISDQ